MLVDYSDSSSESDQPPQARRRGARTTRHDGGDPVARRDLERAPPLPASFHSLYATNVRGAATDDPALHHGRKRQIPHVVGHWPTHIYLEWHPSKPELVMIERVIRHAGRISTGGAPDDDADRHVIHSLLRSELGAPLPLHISLSAPLVLQTEQRQSFQESIQTQLTNSALQPFTVTVTKLDWVANSDRTRFFLVLRLSRPGTDELNQLLWLCNTVVRQYGLPALYETDENEDRQSRAGVGAGEGPGAGPRASDRSHTFHISIAWALHEPGEQARTDLVALGRESPIGLPVSFSLLKLKIGNIVLDLPLGGV